MQIGDGEVIGVLALLRQRRDVSISAASSFQTSEKET